MAQYLKPPAVVSRVLNPVLVTAIQKLGIRPGGMLALRVKGRTSGRLNTVPLNPVEVEGKVYLFSPRGNAQWVRHVRAAAGNAEIAFGRTTSPVTLTEITDRAVKLAVTRAYVTRFYSAVGKIMQIDKNPPDSELESRLDNHPVFLVERH